MRSAVLAAFFIAALGSNPLQAQGWPQKPVRIINPFAPGGGTDTFARPLAIKLGEELGRSVIIENMGGAGGTIGAANAARAGGDGYTWFMGAVHHTIAESFYPKLSYSLERDFIPVTLVASVPNVVVMHPKHESIKSVKELVAFAKANPGILNYGSAGSGTTHHMTGELFKIATGVQLTHIPYKGAGPMMQDLLAGQVDLAFDGMGTSATQIKAGRLRPLAVTSAQRSELVPEVPTMHEAGFAGFEVTTWYAFWAVKGTPAPILERFHQATAKVLKLPDIQALWAAQSATAGGQSSEEFGRFVKSEIAKWAKVVKDSGAKIDG
jgi:tripartite-type tricarboxylate transporter receptor subunit TctC